MIIKDVIRIKLDLNNPYLLARGGGSVVKTTVFDLVAHRVDSTPLSYHLTCKEISRV